jgi:hypothetical protein
VNIPVTRREIKTVLIFPPRKYQAQIVLQDVLLTLQGTNHPKII